MNGTHAASNSCIFWTHAASCFTDAMPCTGPGLLESLVCWFGRPLRSPSSCPVSCSEVWISMFQVNFVTCQSVPYIKIEISTCWKPVHPQRYSWIKRIVQKQGKVLQDPTVPPTKPPHPLKDLKDSSLAILTVVPGNMAKSSCDIEIPQLFDTKWNWVFLKRETTWLRMNTLGVHNPGAFNCSQTAGCTDYTLPSRLEPTIVKPVSILSSFTLWISCRCLIVAPCVPMMKPMWFALTKANPRGFSNIHTPKCPQTGLLKRSGQIWENQRSMSGIDENSTTVVTKLWNA